MPFYKQSIFFTSKPIKNPELIFPNCLIEEFKWKSFGNWSNKAEEVNLFNSALTLLQIEKGAYITRIINYNEKSIFLFAIEYSNSLVFRLNAKKDLKDLRNFIRLAYEAHEIAIAS